MNKTMFRRPVMNYFTIAASMMLLFTSCKKNGKGSSEDEQNFLIYAEAQDGATEVYHGVPTLEKGQYSIGNAIEFGAAWADQLDNGKFYGGRLDDIITEYSFDEQTGFAALKTLKNPSGFPFDGPGYINDIGQGELALIETGGEYYFDESDEIPVYVVNSNTLSITKMGKVPLDLPAGSIVYVNGIKAHGNNLVVTYVVFDKDWNCLETSYAAFLNRSTMNYLATSKDLRTTSIGISHMAGRDHAIHNGDLYIASSNSNWWNANESVPAGILRIKAGQTQFDPTYFVNMTALSGGNFSVYLKDVGNGKAITKLHRKDMITQYIDYNTKFCIEHWVVDLANGTAQKMNIPLSNRTRLNIVHVSGNKYAIAANTQEGNFFYIYDSSNGSIVKGAEYVGGEVYGTAKLP